MVVISDIKSDFFNILIGERVLVFVSADVDGLCAWKILKHLFKCRHILFSVLVVHDKEHLLSAYGSSHCDTVSHVILINCAANFDVIDFLDTEGKSNTVFFICDSRRPIHVNNFYNQRRVKLLTIEEKFDNVPTFDDVFRDNLSDSDDSEDEDRPRKRSRFDEDHLERRIERRNWKNKRDEILLDYESYSFHASSSAAVIFDLAWKISLDSNNLLWCAIVGSTSQHLHQRINRDRYMESLDSLQNHVTRLGHATAGGGQEKGLCLALEEELCLWLYRHWTLNEAMDVSMVTTTRFKLFTLKGRKRLLDFLAQIGIPQRECNQKFSSMDMDMKSNLTHLFSQYGEQFGLDRRELFLPSFVARSGYRCEISALDATLVCAAVLESSTNGIPSENFQAAMNVLSCSNSEAMQEGILVAQRQLKAVANQVHNFLDTDEIIVFGSFLYVHVPHNSFVSAYAKNSLCQSLLAKYVLATKAAVRPSLGRNRRTAQMPLILCLDLEEPGRLSLVGIPPLQGDDDRNLFGQVFEAAAKSTKSQTLHKKFDTNMIEINKEDMLKLFEAVASMLTS